MLLEAIYKVELENRFGQVLESANADGNLIIDLYNFLKSRGVDTKIINNILSSVKEETVKKEIQKIVDRVDMGNKDIEDALFSAFNSLKISIADKIKLIKTIQKESILNEAYIFGGKNKLDFLEMVDFDKIPHDIMPNEFEKFIKKIFGLKISKQGQGRTGTGVGEILLAVLGGGRLGKKGDNGDIIILKQGKPIGAEVKGQNGVISTIDGIELFENMKKETIVALFKDKGIKISAKILGKNDFKKFFEKDKETALKVFKFLYFDRLNDKHPATSKLKEIFKKYQKNFNSIHSGKEFDNLFNNLIQDYGEVVFEQYKKQEGFDILIYINNKDGIYASFEDGSQFLYDISGFVTNGSSATQIKIVGVK